MSRADVLRGWRERWRGLDPAVVRTIGSELLAGRPVTADVFGDVAGRVDLRGFPLTHVITGRQSGPRGVSVGDDLTAARPRDLQLVGVDLGTTSVDIRLPQDDAHWVIDYWPGYLHRVAATIDGLSPGDEKLTAKIWLDYARQDSGPHQLTGFVATWDLDHLGGAALTELLRRAV